MKKKLSFLLTILLLVNTVLGMFPTFAESYTESADAAAIADGKAFKIGTEYYTHLEEAINAVEDYGTIYQIADYELIDTSREYWLAKNKNFTLDGQILDKNAQHTLKINTSNNYPLVPTRNVTIKNLNLWSDNSVLQFTPQEEGDTFVLENVKAVTVAENRPFLLAGGSSVTAQTVLAKFVIKDCEITGVSAPFFVGNNGTSSWDIEIINSTLENKHATSSYPYAVLLYKSTSIDLTVDGTSKLLNTSTTSTAPNVIKVSTSTANDPKACVITLEEGAMLGLMSESGAPAGSFIAKGSSTASYVLNDKGANYVASAYMQAKGVTLPEVKAANGQKLATKGEFTNGTVNVVDAGTYTNTAATAEITLKYANGTAYTPVDTDVFLTSAFEYYSSIEDAANALYEYGTIYMLKNYEYTGSYQFKKALTLEGNGKTVTMTGTEQAYAWHFRSSTVLKNITITDNNYSPLTFAPLTDKPLYVMENVTGTVEEEIARPFIAIGIDYSADKCINTVADVIIKDSTLSGQAPVFVGNDGVSKYNVSIVNSTLTNPNANSSYPYVILLYKSPKINLTVDKDSELVNSSTSAVAPAVVQVGTNESNAPSVCSIVFEAGSALKLMSESGASAGEFVRVTDMSKNLRIDNQGAGYTASAYMQKQGVMLPPNIGGEIVGYRANGTLYSASMGEYKNESATADITFVVENVDVTNTVKNGFTMMKGAATRTQLPYGLRFTATLSKEAYETLLAIDSNFEFGMIVAKTRKVVGDFNLEGMSVADYEVIPCTTGMQQLSADTYAFRHGIYGFGKTKEDFTTAYSAIAYVTIHSMDGTTQTFYTTYNQTENSRSIYDVAAAAVQSGVSDPFLDSILSVCSES